MKRINILFAILLLVMVSALFYRASAYDLPPDEVLEWAFGEDYGSMGLSEAGDAWNERHSDIFECYGSEDIDEFFDKVEEAYDGLQIQK